MCVVAKHDGLEVKVRVSDFAQIRAYYNPGMDTDVGRQFNHGSSNIYAESMYNDVTSLND